MLSTPLPLQAGQGYATNFVDLVEMVYGEGYLSQGGLAMVERMFERVELDENTLLDLGCGIGGPALHLVKNHAITVVGIDPEALMIHKSRIALEQLRSTPLRGSAYFVAMEDPLTLEPFPDESFDIVTSKESILHVPHAHKLNYFREIFRVLKPGGQLVILDWQHRSPNYSDAVRKMMEIDGIPFYLTTPEEYRETVVQAGFSAVTIDDMTPYYAEQSQEDIALIDAKRLQIIEQFDQETYDNARESWSIQGQAFEDRELLVGLIKATKIGYSIPSSGSVSR